MSFYKITDPKERRRMFEKLSETRKNVQEQFLEDKIGKIESSQSLKKFFKPITESQRELTKEIKEQLTPIRDKVLTLPTQALAIQPAGPLDPEHRSAAPPLETHEELMNVGPIAAEYLEKFIDPEEVDKTFGIYLDKDGTWKIGNEKVELDGNDLIIGRTKYEGTRGLWELIVSNEPSEQNYDDGDLATYSEIMLNTNAIRRDNDPTNPRPKSSRSWKWTNVVKDIWYNRNTYEGQGTKTIVIPSDPNALLERLNLLMASREAGNTGTRNELVSICDELLRQRVISKNQYKNIMLRL